jgi:membrane protein
VSPTPDGDRTAIDVGLIEAASRNPRFRWMQTLVLDTYDAWRQDRTLRLGAGLAYYAMFTIVPFLALTTALAGRLFSMSAFEEFLAERADQLGITASEETGASLAAALDRLGDGMLFGLVGLGTLLFTSSLVFLALDDAVNTIWHVPVRSGVRNSVRRRLFSFLMVLVTISVIVGAFALHAISGAAESFLPNDTVLLDTVVNLLSSVVSAAALGAAMVLLYRFVGPVRVGWGVVLLAASITTVFLMLGTAAIGWYLRNFGGASLGGAFGAVLLALTWVYYEAQILLAGVQLTKVLARRDAGLEFLIEPETPAPSVSASLSDPAAANTVVGVETDTEEELP